MRRMILARWALSVMIAASFAGAGVALGWLPREVPEASRGKQVVVLAMSNSGQPAEVLLSSRDAGAPVDATRVPPPQTAAPSTASADIAAREEAARPEGTPVDAGVLTITVPSVGPSGGDAQSDGSEAEASVPRITPDPPQGFAPPRPLPSAPVPAVAEAGPDGILPKVAPGGRLPRTVYARPFEGDNRAPLVAIIIGGIGLNAKTSEEAIRRLPGEVTLALAPYPANVADWAAEARRAGHELLLEVPMEPFNAASTDLGPSALLTSLTPRENVERLRWHMSRFPGYVGVMNYLGGRFLSNASHVSPMVRELADRGLLFVETAAPRRSVTPDASDAAGLAYLSTTRTIDLSDDPAAIRENLERLAQTARERGIAIGVGAAIPETIEAIVEWAPTLQRAGVRLAPVTAVLARASTS